MNRKYPEVKGYWVYSIQIKSNGKYYIGVSKSKKCSKRWHKALYKNTALEDYFDEWQDMVKTVLIDGLSKEEALRYEDNIIRALKMNGLCINKQRSGLISVSDKNAYCREKQKQHYENDSEFREKQKERAKQWQKDNREKVNQRSKQWQKDNKEKKREYDKQRYERKKLEKQQQTVVD